MLLSAANIEQLLNEFHYASTGNARKREIEQQLVQWQSTADAWREILPQLGSVNNKSSSSSPNFYVWFFNVSTIELTITRRWLHLVPADRNRIRETIWHNYTTLVTADVLKVQRDKFAQLIALMGKREYPEEHNTYMEHIVQLLNTNFMLGVTLLRSTSEELSSTKDDIPSERKLQFHTALAASMPDVMDKLSQCMTVFCSRINGNDVAAQHQHGSAYRQLCEAMPSDDAAFL